jgi:hypothetical protein
MLLGHVDCFRHLGSVKDFLEKLANSRQVDPDDLDVGLVGTGCRI